MTIAVIGDMIAEADTAEGMNAVDAEAVCVSVCHALKAPKAHKVSKAKQALKDSGEYRVKQGIPVQLKRFA